MLDTHNNYRALHDSEPLVYDYQLAAQAQLYAEKLQVTDKYRHAPSLQELNEGENLIWQRTPRLLV